MTVENGSVPRRSWYPRVGKRVLDLALAVALAVITSPLTIVVALLVRVKLGSPVLFRQERPGLNGVTFDIVKFRSMTDQRAPDGAPLPDSQRLTRFGRLLRASSLDELPELWNVLRGHMSMVGPRPLRVHYLERYDSEQARRHLVRPGITGWAQINGRNAAEWKSRLAMDVWYVDNVSFSLDMRILWRTITAVIRRDGVSEPGQDTVSEFLGNPTHSPVSERP